MKPPLFAALASALAFAVVTAVASAAIDPAAWDSAVAALQEADPTIEPLAPEPGSLTVVGGAQAGPTLAVAARQRLDEVTGRMTVVVGSGTIFKASVVCVDAVTIPGGGGYAMVAGALDQPLMNGDHALVFRITDSGEPGGELDMWDQQTLPTVPECVAAPGTTLIATGNVIVDPGS